MNKQIVKWGWIATASVALVIAAISIKDLSQLNKDMAEFELAKVHFENISQSLGNVAVTSDRLKEISLETNVPFNELSKVVLDLAQANVPLNEQDNLLESLAKRATAFGIPVERLSKDFRD